MLLRNVIESALLCKASRLSLCLVAEEWFPAVAGDVVRFSDC